MLNTIGFPSRCRQVLIAAGLIVVVLAFGSASRTESALGSLVVAIDCNVNAPGVQATCPVLAGSGTLDVDVVLVNQRATPMTPSALNFKLVTDERVLRPRAGVDQNLNANPDFRLPGTDWSCSLPLPQADEDPDPNIAVSFISCYTVADTGVPIGPAEQRVMARVSYDVVGGPASAATLTLSELAVFQLYDNLPFEELGECNYADTSADAVFADCRVGAVSVTASGCPGDIDCDGFADPAAVAHTAPANLNTAVDNCPTVYNPDQLNTDGNFIDQSPPYAVDDKTSVMSDAQGDACDPDDDGDGLTDWTETLALPCASSTGATNPSTSDSDGDRILDGAECTLGKDPASAASKPTPAQCAAYLGVTTSIDTDGDRIKDYVEFCSYNSNPASNDSDGDAGVDGARDGCEVASINGDRIVNAGDQGMLSAEIMRVPPPAKLVNMDFNKDGVINAGDQGLQASFVSPAGQCP